MRLSSSAKQASMAGMAGVAAFFLVSAWAAPQIRQRFQRLWEGTESNQRAIAAAEFVFARVQFGAGRGGYGPGGGGWAHDYPDAEEHILQIANEATAVNLSKMSYVITRLDNDDVFRYPFLYFSEVGRMALNDKEVTNFREYLNRGGFAMIDDFDSQYSLDWFQSQMRRVFPERNFVELTIDHPIFHTFYDIPTLDLEPPYDVGSPPKFYGYFDDKGRLCMIINLNNDIGDFWEWIDQPMYPLKPSTEALRLGINYIIFSMTH
ncbi:MAG: hypothetical protein A3H28_15235 [Acidobacteria bacterium RIFCSPLOWO2_02_FULL_61_28]|nr:MAG: hypothetical protein A3H28_15235 [Acidobacteria bacterium RIFCSPLOWO2_02_FULL_61_28]